MMTRKCHKCSEEMTATETSKVVSVGDWRVKVDNIPATQCMNGHMVFTAQELRHVELTVATRLIEIGVVTGELFRYARKALGFSQKRIGALIDRDNATISKWETGALTIPPLIFAVVRALLVEEALGESSTRELLERQLERRRAVEPAANGSPTVVDFAYEASTGRDIDRMVQEQIESALRQALEDIEARRRRVPPRRRKQVLSQDELDLKSDPTK